LHPRFVRQLRVALKIAEANQGHFFKEEQNEKMAMKREMSGKSGMSPEKNKPRTEERMEQEEKGVVAATQGAKEGGHLKRIEGMFAELTGKMDGLMGEIGGLKAKVDGIESEMKSEFEKVRAEMEDIKEEIWMEEQERKSWASEWEAAWTAKEMKWEQTMNEMRQNNEGTWGSGRNRKGDEEDDDEIRKLQVVVGGFDEDTDAEVIKKEIEKFLAVGTRRNKVTKVDTLSQLDPAQMGVIEFESIAAKKGFHKKVKGVKGKVKLPNGKEMWWKDNRNFEERVWDKTLGLVKYLLIEKAGCTAEDVTIDWDVGLVKVKNGKKKGESRRGQCRCKADSMG